MSDEEKPASTRAPILTSHANLAKFYPESLDYRLKRFFLGKPLVSEQLSGERLNRPIALGVLAPDCISSSAYGTEEILTQMTPFIGLAAFALVVPIMFVIIGVLFFVTTSYLDVIKYYTTAGGSYVVARDNFGPKVAQIAAVALLIDYTVTVAVQCSAGTAALTTAFPALKTSFPLVGNGTLLMTVAVVLILIFGNLRGLREAGSYFAIPTYFYVTMLSLTILIGYYKKIVGSLHVIAQPATHLLVGHKLGHSGNGLLMGLAFITLLRAYANGGSSLTGLEAISNGVGSFRRPESRNARSTLVVMSSVLAFLLVGTTLLAHWTHAFPYDSGSPTVVGQEVSDVFGATGVGHYLFLIVQFATVLILYTGGNTSFNGFPFLANYVAGDRYLPRQLTKRGHRLAFSNGIIVLGVVSLSLIVAFNASVNALIALYAIGVFTGFTLAGAGMVARHLREKGAHWRRGVFVNALSAGVTSIVVLVFVFAKFTEGAWIIVVVGPIMYWGLLRFHKTYVGGDQLGDRRVRGPARRPGGVRARGRRRARPGRLLHGDPAPTRIRLAAATSAARPHRGQHRERRDARTAHRRDHHPLQRAASEVARRQVDRRAGERRGDARWRARRRAPGRRRQTRLGLFRLRPDWRPRRAPVRRDRRTRALHGHR